MLNNYNERLKNETYRDHTKKSLISAMSRNVTVLQDVILKPRVKKINK